MMKQALAEPAVECDLKKRPATTSSVKFALEGDRMTEERIEEHKHVISETEEGISESHSHKIVERDREEPEVTTIVKKTIIEEEEVE